VIYWHRASESDTPNREHVAVENDGGISWGGRRLNTFDYADGQQSKTKLEEISNEDEYETLDSFYTY